MTRRAKQQRAIKRVKELKDFYRHIRIFILVNGTFYLFKSGWLTRFLPEWFPKEDYYFSWIDSNVLIWGLILLFHCLYTYRNNLPFVKSWEKRKIQEFIDKDRNETKKYY